MKFLIQISSVISLDAAPFAVHGENYALEEATVEAQVHPVVVIGGGIGALTSSLYLARAGMQPIVLEGKAPGGLLTQSHSVQNWPGELEIDGTTLTDKVRAQAEASGARFRREEVVSVDFSKKPYTIKTQLVGEEGEYRTMHAEAVIIAMGTQPNLLGVPGESGPDGYWGRGVTNCAICDGSLYHGQTVGVVGGGDSAVLEALYLSNIAKQVYVFVRKDAFRGIEESRIQSLLEKPNVKILYRTIVEEIKGDGKKLTKVALNSDGKKSEIQLDGLFLAIGSTPNSKIFQNALKLDRKGYIVLKKDQETSQEGVYAIGDIVDPVYKQAISAAGDGAKAALQAQQYISDRTNGLIVKNRHKTKKPVMPEANLVIEVFSMEQFERELRESQVPVVVDFYATWCGPCKRLSPMFEYSASQLSGRVKFLKVNVDKMMDLSRSYEIRAMPTVLVFDPSGKVVDRKVGTDQISDLLKKLEAGR